MTDKKKTEELNEAELDQVTGGAGGKELLGHELTHVQQQGGNNFIGETEKNLGIEARGQGAGKAKIDKIAAQSGSGSI